MMQIKLQQVIIREKEQERIKGEDLEMLPSKRT